MARTYSARLGPFRAAGLGCGGVALFLLLAYAAGWLFWSWLLMLGMGNWGPYAWSYTYVLSHWGLLCPFVLG